MAAALGALTGKPTDTYWTQDVFGFTLGHKAGDYAQSLENGEYVVIGTPDSTPTGLVHNHAYAVLDYYPSTDLFHLFNPWGNTSESHGEPEDLLLTGDELDANFTYGAAAARSAPTQAGETSVAQAVLAVGASQPGRSAMATLARWDEALAALDTGHRATPARSNGRRIAREMSPPPSRARFVSSLPTIRSPWAGWKSAVALDSQGGQPPR
jgi:hypothetical protein